MNAKKPEDPLDFVERLTVLMTILLMAGLVTFPLYSRGFRELCDLWDTDMPEVTRLLATSWFAPLTAVVPGMLLLAGLTTGVRRSPRLRKVMVASAMAAAMIILLAFNHLIQQAMYDLTELLNALDGEGMSDDGR
jgi:hypothetical protein